MILLTTMTDISRTNMVPQEVTTCHHMVSILTIMAHNKTTKEIITEVVEKITEVVIIERA